MSEVEERALEDRFGMWYNGRRKAHNRVAAVKASSCNT
jgi:hypothetical protein